MFEKKDDTDDTADDAAQSESEPKSFKSTASKPRPPYGGNIPKRFRDTPFDDLPEHLQAAVKGS